MRFFQKQGYLALTFVVIVTIACSLTPQISLATDIAPTQMGMAISTPMLLPSSVPLQPTPTNSLVNIEQEGIFEVSAVRSWQNTGVYLKPGNSLYIQYKSSRWSPWPGGTCDGSGMPDTDPVINNIVTGVLHASLIGKIGDNEPFFVGDIYHQDAATEGYLFLRINDTEIGDNSGSITVSISPAPTQEVSVTATPSPEGIIQKTVFAIAYLDAEPLYDPDEHQRELINGLRQASIWHGYENPHGIPALSYRTYGGAVYRLYEAPPYRQDNDKFDYQAVYERFDLCKLVQARVIDEVWIWESGTGRAWEWVTNGPTWSWINDGNVPNCGSTITTLNLNYQREIDVAFESYAHRLEGAFITLFPCYFYTDTWPWTDWPEECNGLVSDQFGFVARPFSGNGMLGVCGDVHHPPNILNDSEYVYDSSTQVDSICQDWRWDGNAQVNNVNCEAWDCTEKGYLIWWMQNLPGYDSHVVGRDGQLMNNWWEALFR